MSGVVPVPAVNPDSVKEIKADFIDATCLHDTHRAIKTSHYEITRRSGRPVIVHSRCALDMALCGGGKVWALQAYGDFSVPTLAEFEAQESDDWD